VKQGYTDITVVLDRSGSMSSIRDDMNGGFAAFVADQQGLPGTCLVSMVQFDGTATEVRYVGTPIGEVGPLDLSPRGNTPLLDAVAFSIRLTGERLAALAEEARPENVLLLIITDGQENASKHTTAAALKSTIEHQRAVYKWDFIYLGANVNSFAEAQAMGIPPERTADYDADATGVRTAWEVMSPKFAGYRGGDKEALKYTEEERRKMKRTKTPT
jgi:hypothetical protein